MARRGQPKKLTDAARHWAGANAPRGDVAADLRAQGIPEEALATLPEPSDPDCDVCEVWEDNWPAVLAFLACQTQWRREFAGMSGVLVWQGLDYPALISVIRLHGHRGQSALAIFEQVQVMEGAALAILNKSD